MKKNKISRLFISTIIGALVMLCLFYIWHGVVLNDLSSLQYDQNIFIGLLFILYLFISFALAFVISIYNPDKNRFFKHISIGIFTGFLIYLTAFVLGVSFAGEKLEHIVLDFSWQMLEQMLGASFISTFYLISYRIEKANKLNT